MIHNQSSLSGDFRSHVVLTSNSIMSDDVDGNNETQSVSQECKIECEDDVSKQDNDNHHLHHHHH